MSTPIDRRDFLAQSMAGGALLGVAAQTRARAASPNERIAVGVAGLSRGAALARTFAAQPGCRVKSVCDADAQRAARCAAAIEEQTGAAPATAANIQELFDDPDLDAVVLALPAHWHAPAAILACEAGKHVYVEKPCAHNPHETELLVAAARKRRRAVQMGVQRRSWPALREAMERLREGVIGRPYYARAWYAAVRGGIGRGAAADPPPHLDYDAWQGPAPRRPYKDNLIHYNWHWHWHWGTGELGNNGVHALDLCRWGLGVDYPEHAVSSGGRFHFDDDQETPDTQTAAFQFPGGAAIAWEGLSCVRPGGPHAGFGAAFFGEGGSLEIAGGGYLLRDRAGDEIERQGGPSDDGPHAANFLDAIRGNAPDTLHAEIAEGAKSTLLPLLGNIAYRTGRAIRCGEAGRILDDPEAEALWRREYAPGWEPRV